MNRILIFVLLLFPAGSGAFSLHQSEDAQNHQQRFAENVFQALGHPDSTRLEAAIDAASYRALPLVHDLLYQASSPQADPRVLEAAKRIANLLEDRFHSPAAGEAVGRFVGFDESEQKRRIAFETILKEGAETIRQGHFDAALEKGRAALEISKELGEPFLEARASRLLGEIEGGCNRSEVARNHFIRAAKIDESLNLEVQLGWDFTLLGDLDFRQGWYPSSLVWYGKALVKAEACLESKSKGILLSNRGALFSILGRYKEADESLSLALETARHIGDHTREAYVLSVRGGLESGRGNYGEAVELFHSSIEAWMRSGDQLGEGRACIQLAGVLSEVGQSADAEDMVESALDLFTAKDRPVERGRALMMQGLTYLDRGHPLQAIDPLEQGFRFLEEAGDAPGAAEALQHKATAMLKLGKFPEGEQLFAEALERRSSLGDLFGSVLSLTGLGDTLRAQGLHVRARERYLSALEKAEPLGLPELLWRTQYGLGVVAESEGRIQLAMDHYGSAIKEVEKIRKLLIAPTLRQRYLGDKLSLYRRLSRLLSEQGRLEEGFRMAEAAKARTLLELTAYRPRVESLHPGLPDETVQKLRDSESRIQLLELRLGESVGRENTRTMQADLEHRLRDARAEHKAARIQLELAAPRVTELTGLKDPPSLGAVQGAIPGDVALLDYLIGPEGSTVIVVRHDRARMVDLNTTEEKISEWILSILRPIEQLRNGKLDLANLHFDVKAATALYQTLILPLWDEIGSCRQLWIVPDGPLRKLPFALLVRRMKKHPVNHHLLFAQYKGCRFLIEDMAIAYLPAAGLLLNGRPLDPEESRDLRAVVVADPQPVPDGAAPLPAAHAEAAAVTRHIGTGRTELLLGPQALEASCKSIASRASFFHLACHASLDDRRPAFSRLALAPGRDEDGWLHAYEIERIQLRASHVVLSACETVGTAGRGEGLLGLSRAFLQAGARSVTATAWVVDDQASAYLMDRFYGAMKGGENPVQALRSAQIATLQGGRRPGVLLIHPFFWAGFLHVGNP